MIEYFNYLMDTNTISENAKINIAKCDNVTDINKICTRCGFIKTKQSNVNGYCLLCEQFYSFQSENKVNTTTSNKCDLQCAIS